MPAATLACGDGLVSGDWRGEPLITVGGDVLVRESLGDLDGDVAVAALWNGGRDTVDIADQSVDATLQFPSRYTLRFYQPPPPEVRNAAPDGSDSLFAMAVLVLFEDLDADQNLDLGAEIVLGMAPERVLMWSTQDGAPGDDTSPDPAQDLPPPVLDGLGGHYLVRDTGSGSCAPGAGVTREPTDVQLEVGVDCRRLPDPDCIASSLEWLSLCPR